MASGVTGSPCDCEGLLERLAGGLGVEQVEPEAAGEAAGDAVEVRLQGGDVFLAHGEQRPQRPGPSGTAPNCSKNSSLAPRSVGSVVRISSNWSKIRTTPSAPAVLSVRRALGPGIRPARRFPRQAAATLGVGAAEIERSNGERTAEVAVRASRSRPLLSPRRLGYSTRMIGRS